MSSAGGTYRGNPRAAPPSRGGAPFPQTPNSGIPVPATSPSGPSHPHPHPHSEAGSSVSDSRKGRSKRDEVFQNPINLLIPISFPLMLPWFVLSGANMVFSKYAVKSKMTSTKRNTQSPAPARHVRLPQELSWLYARHRLCR